MKLFTAALSFCLLFALSSFALAAPDQQRRDQPRQHDRHGSDHERPGHGFGVREFDRFHEILHPLQHEALPANDYTRIRAAAEELTTRGQAIIELPVPQGVRDADEYRRELARFREALTKYKTDATEGTDDQLRASYEAVHDHFEMLVAQLPRRPH